MFFEKEKVYCKLTVASDIRKGLLHVSFGAVRSGCCGVLKKAFIRFALHEPKKRLYRESKSFPYYRKLYELPAKTAFFTYKKPFILTNLSLFPSKVILFCPPSPITTTLNLLFAKTAAVLLISALTPYAVKPEPRTDSNHCRRYPTKLQLLAKPVT